MLKHCRPDNLVRGHLSLLHRPFIPANDYSEIGIAHITQPCSEVYWGYFRLLVFENSLVIFSSRFPTYRLVIMLNLPIFHVCLRRVEYNMK